MNEEFDRLFAAATAARANAYVPYSHYRVGAAILTDDGRIFAGANIENAAYPQGQCAEATAIGAMGTAGGRRIAAVVVIGGEDGDGDVCTPCGGCRQRLREFARPETAIHLCGPEGLRRTMTMEELLPASFGPHNLGRD
ncbi:MAG TPA: cytidine deaminase [Alphaproteobacteria bacterium]|nr:cytidine deaminase [Alphaproteobacteria bacterium]